MKTALFVVLLSAFVAVHEAKFVNNVFEDVKPYIKDAVKDTNRALSQAFLAKQAEVRNVGETKNQLILAEKFSEVVGQELEHITNEVEKSLLIYEARSEEIKSILHKFVDQIEKPPMTKINYIPILAQNIADALQEINKLQKEGTAALQHAKTLAESIEKDAIFKSVTQQVLDLQARGVIGWVMDLIGNGADWLMDNLISVIGSISPSLANSFTLIKYIATVIVNNISTLGSALTVTAAEQLLSLLGPWKDELGHLYQQIEHSLQETFGSLLFGDKN